MGEIDTSSEDWRRECEARHVCNLPTLSERRRYILGVREQRGNPPADQLERDVRHEWVKNLALYKSRGQSALKPSKRSKRKSSGKVKKSNATVGNIDGSA